MAASPASTRPRRQRNPRGQGERLREEIIDAALDLVADTGNLAQLSLRAVAKRAGITAPSIYRHFPSLDHLAAAVVERCIAELAAARADPDAQTGDPVAALRRRLHGYARFALAHPGYYQVMFGPDTLPGLVTDYEHSPRRSTFESLVAAVTRCQQAGVDRSDDPRRTATLLWAGVHGLVSLRLSRPRFPWPPIGELLDDTIDRLLRLPGPPPGHGRYADGSGAADLPHSLGRD
jgi:AcrR family transcriptional regulator